MTNPELARLDGVAQAELVQKGEVSSLELVDAAIARIEALEPQIHAISSSDFERARKAASDPSDGPFKGVPFLVKDLLAYPGHKLEMGSRLFSGNVAAEGSAYTEAIDRSGLITLGKTTTSEFGLLGSTETLSQGITRNPWDLTRSATGSSGGSAAAVASGMVPLAHASDGGGSIRIPASACGLFGFKPSRGRCVATADAQAEMNDLISEHCVSRSVRDSALFLSSLEDRSASSPHEPIDWNQQGNRVPLRIGLYLETLMGALPSADAAEAVAVAAKCCTELGHEVIEVPAPDVDGGAVSSGFFAYAGAGMSGMADMMEGMLGRSLGSDDLEPFTLELIEWYRKQPETLLFDAKASIQEAGVAMRRYLEQFDVVLCPTLPSSPPKLGQLSPGLGRAELIRRTEVFAGYTPIHNIAGAPAMSLPLHWSVEGLPHGSHFAARPGADRLLIDLAYQLEESMPWRDRRPEGLAL